ncbi:MAG: NfeD family protein [Pseudomonadales bacterium]|nr:NfeD family protein [Pseudomonadales bacterium]
MESFVATIQPWHWLVLGILLLVAESFGTGGFVIGIAIAAFVQSINAVSFPNLSWGFQILVFGVNCVLFTFIYWRFFRKFNQRTDAPVLNDRAAQLVGRQLLLEQPLSNGVGKVLIGDTFWRASADRELPTGTKIEIVSSNGMNLVVRAVDD